MSRWGRRLERLEIAQRARLWRELEAMSDEDLKAITASAGLPDVRAMTDPELDAIIRYLERGGDPLAWRWEGVPA